jgi:2-polyprenyl-3-methyl-5-hydroxy-6-metoxy-1,4-benzoquinol methylase
VTEKAMMFDLDVAGRQAFSSWPHSPSAKAYQLVTEGSVVLDVGCAGGHMGAELRKKNCVVHGIEIDAATAVKARAVCASVVEGDLDAMQALPFSRGMFDCVLALDVLEHLRRPDRALRLLQPLLKPEGRLVCSIPNVARFELRMGLLFGRFEYGDGGALSKGHLRFFTRRTASQLLEEAGFRIENVLSTGLASMIHVFPTLTAYQFVFVCRSR